MKKSNFKIENNEKKIKISWIIFIFVLVALVSLIILYFTNSNVQNFIDQKILKKNLETEDLITITGEEFNKDYVFACDNKIIILNKNELKIFNKDGKNEKTFEIEISNPIFESNGKYLYIVENNGGNIYLIEGNNIIWQKSVEGNIESISVNKNGYLVVNITGTAYKNVIKVFDNAGDEKLTKYISSTKVQDIEISDDNEKLAIAKIDYSGITIKSLIEIIDIDKAETIQNFEAGTDDLIVNIKYQNDNLVCMYDKYINTIENGNTVDLTQFEDNKSLFADIELDKSIVEIKKENSITKAKLINSNSKKQLEYDIEDEPKAIYTSGKTICMNLGTKLIFINTNGNLIKTYSSSNEIQKVILGDNIAGIIYNGEIRIIEL